MGPDYSWQPAVLLKTCLALILVSAFSIAVYLSLLFKYIKNIGLLFRAS